MISDHQILPVTLCVVTSFLAQTVNDAFVKSLTQGGVAESKSIGKQHLVLNMNSLPFSKPP